MRLLDTTLFAFIYVHSTYFTMYYFANFNFPCGNAGIFQPKVHGGNSAKRHQDASFYEVYSYTFFFALSAPSYTEDVIATSFFHITIVAIATSHKKETTSQAKAPYSSWQVVDQKKISTQNHLR